ncbi:30S ribosomal protein S6 [bacterium]|nr:MAG: 30S ribosomal protein S6 [bacterium]
MPRYELMYILASSVSDDQVPETSKQIEQTVSDFGGNNLNHELLGKKKLAYQIGKTRNGHYGVINFDMEGKDLAALEAKIRTQKNTIIRHLVINIDEHLERLEKDRVVQSKIKRRPPEETVAAPTAESKPKPTKKTAPVSNEQLDEEIEKALSEEVQ